MAIHLPAIHSALDYYRKFTPVNFSEERRRFFGRVEKKEAYNPVFQYRDPLETEDYREIKESLRREKGRDPVIDAFIAVYLHVADMMIAWKKSDYRALSMLSGELFGSAAVLDPARAAAAYKTTGLLLPEASEVFDAQRIAERFREEFARRQLSGWSIFFDDAIAGNVSIYEVEKKIMIRTGAKETALGLDCLVAHELDGHALQAFNAMESRRHRQWLLSYIGTERQYEGYATFVEINNLTIPHIACDFRDYLVFMIATAEALQASFYDTYRRMVFLCGDTDLSFYAAYKAKRGFQKTMQPGAFQKENAYLFGATDIIRLVEAGEDNFFRLSQGCFPLCVIRLIPAGRLKWIGATRFNRSNFDFFKQTWKTILKG